MPVRIVQSKQNSRLKLLRQVLAHPGRTGQPDQSIGLEGPNLLSEALHAGLHISTIFVAEESQTLLDELTLRKGLSSEIEILLLPGALLGEALTTEAPQPIAALVDPPQWGWADFAAERASGVFGAGHNDFFDLDSVPRAGPILVLAALQDPGNLGTILRSAEAFGAAGVISLPGTVSPWNPKALRASAGSAFRLPIVAANVDEAFAWLRQSGRHIWTTAVQGAECATTADLARPIALIIGNEGNGVQAEIASQADGALTIPCPGPVESLNAAVATSILLYEASRQRAHASKSQRSR